MIKVKTKVQCPYNEKCSDVDSSKCVNCLHNEKRSYYQPRWEYWYPWYPRYYEPYHPYYPWITTTTQTWDTCDVTYSTSDNTPTLTTSYYQALS